MNGEYGKVKFEWSMKMAGEWDTKNRVQIRPSYSFYLWIKTPSDEMGSFDKNTPFHRKTSSDLTFQLIA